MVAVGLSIPISAAAQAKVCDEDEVDLIQKGFGLRMDQRQIDLPAANQTVMVGAGASMASQVTAPTYDILKGLTEPAVAHGVYGDRAYSLTIPAGGFVSAGTGRIPAFSVSFKYDGDSAGTDDLSRSDMFVYVHPRMLSIDALVPLGLLPQTVVFDDPQFDIAECVSLAETTSRRELVYSGVSNGMVALLYREFDQDLARPAFSQALTFDLSKDNEIGFQGARLRIDRATNTEVTFTVIRPLGSKQP
jgi:hypothetical protein